MTQKLIATHLAEGQKEETMRPGEEIALTIDQTLTQDATGTLVMLELEAMELDCAQTELSCQYVDHNLIQADHKNPDDHLFLQSACERFGLWYSPPGNGVSHPVHMERFGKPGKTLLGADSHTCAAGALGMLAIGAGGLEVAMCIAGFPFYVKMPEVWGVRLSGALPDWVSAKDVILEMLRRHSVRGGLGRIVEYYGPALAGLSAWDRHVIANMGAELGATTTVFPADEEIRRFLESQERASDFTALVADENAEYDVHEEIDLSTLEPLIAMPSSPDEVRPVREVAGEPIYQSYVGSSANPGYRDFAVAASIVDEATIHSRVSLDVSPTSRQTLEGLMRDGHLSRLIRAGARLHQAGCNGCIGMGQAPASERLSLRTVPRNFPGRSGTRHDRVCLVSPETAAASALSGVVTDPRELAMAYPRIREPAPAINTGMLQPPPDPSRSHQKQKAELVKGPNIVSLPEFEPLPDTLELRVLLKMGDDISTDEILPAGARVLPLRSNIPAISKFCFEGVDLTYPERAQADRKTDGHAIVAGSNYGQGSSREHAALAPRYLGLRLALARGFARIHWQNLVNFGVVPVSFVDDEDYDAMEEGTVLRVDNLRGGLSESRILDVVDTTRNETFEVEHDLSHRQIGVLLAGGLVNWARENAAPH